MGDKGGRFFWVSLGKVESNNSTGPWSLGLCRALVRLACTMNTQNIVHGTSQTLVTTEPFCRDHLQQDILVMGVHLDFMLIK